MCCFFVQFGWCARDSSEPHFDPQEARDKINELKSALRDSRAREEGHVQALAEAGKHLSQLKQALAEVRYTSTACIIFIRL